MTAVTVVRTKACRLLSPPFANVRILSGDSNVLPNPVSKERYGYGRPKGKRRKGVVSGKGGPILWAMATMAFQVPPKRRVCGTKEAADIYGCTPANIRMMAGRGEIWSEAVSDRVFVYDADEIERLAAERSTLRQQGKLGGRRPGPAKSA